MIAVFVLGLLSGGDRTAFGQTLLAHPLVAASIAGWLAGVPSEGLWLGIALSLLSVPDIPVGERRLRDWTTAAVALPFACGPEAGAAAWGLGLLVAPIVAWGGGTVIGLVRAISLARWRRLQDAIDRGDLRRLETEHLLLTALHFLRGGAMSVLIVVLGRSLLGTLEPALEATEQKAFAALWRVAPLLGLPVLFRFHVQQAGWPWLVVGALPALVLVALGAGAWGWP